MRGLREIIFYGKKMLKEPKVIFKSLGDFINVFNNEVIGNYKDKTKIFDRPELRLWFRGQSDATWDLQPGVYRDDFIKKEKENENEQITEARIEKLTLLKERHLFKEFKRRSAGLVPYGITDIDLYLLMQHYGMQTRL